MSRIALCLPNNHPGFDREFTVSLLSVIQSFYLWNHGRDNPHDLRIIIQKDGWIDHMREKLAEEAVAMKADYVLCLDTDMVFPPNLIERMMKLFLKHKNIEAITGLYSWKAPPFVQHVYHEYNRKTDKFNVAAGFPLTEIFQVEGAGFGCVMFKTSILKKMSKPWFEFKYGVYGEDLYFFRKFILENNRPIRMVCDPTISCKHLTQISVDVESYIRQNKILVDDKNVLRPTPDQVQRISDFQQHLTDKFTGKKSLDKKKQT
jgi:hypothetical protein